MAAVPETTPAPPARQAVERLRLPDEWQAAARRALRPALWMAAGWFLAGLAAFWWIGLADRSGLIERLAGLMNYAVSYDLIGYLQFILISGPLSGLAIGIILHRTALRLTRSQFLGLVIAWTAVGLLPAPFFSSSEISTAYIFAWFLAGMLGGWATISVLHRAGARLDGQAQSVVILGWALSLLVGTWLFRFSDLFGILGFALQGFVGGLVTFAALYRQAPGGGGEAGTGLTNKVPAPLAETENPVSGQAAQAAAVRVAAAPAGARAAGLISSLSGALRPAFWLAAGWFLASLLTGAFFFRSDPAVSLAYRINELTDGAIDYFDVELIAARVVAGLLSGLVIGLVANRSGFQLKRRSIVSLMLVWGAIFLIPAILYVLNAPSRILFWFVAGALGGWLTFSVFRRAGTPHDSQTLPYFIAGWAIGLTAGNWFYDVLYDQHLFYTLKDQIGDAVYRLTEWFLAIEAAIAGFTGGLATFAALNNSFKKND